MKRVLVLAALAAVAGAVPACDDGDPGQVGEDAGVDAPVDADLTEPLYDPAHVVMVDIELPVADWDALRQQSRGVSALFGNCLAQPFADPFTYFRGVVFVDGQRLTDVGVRKKGFLGSLDVDRPSLKLKFDEYLPDQRLAGLKTLTLNNAKQDPSFLRQCLSYQTFAAAGVPASRCNFARVRINGAELGLYVNVEAVNKDFLRRHYADEDGNLYEGTLSDFRAGWTGTFELKTNEAANDRADVDALVAALALPDAQLLAAVEPLVDVDRFLTFWATELLTTHWDGYTGNANNFFAYHDPTSGQFQFIPWGTDGTLSTADNPFGGDQSDAVQAMSLLPRRLYQLPATRDRYVARLRELLDGVWDEPALLDEVDRMEALVAPIADPDGSAGLAAAIDDVRAFIGGRRAAVEADLAAGPPTLTVPLRDAPCFEEIGDVSGSFATTWGTIGAANPFLTGTGTLSGAVNGTPLAVTQVGGTSGLDTDAMPPKRQVAVIAQLADGTAAIIAFQIEPAAFVAGADLPLDWTTVLGALYRYTPATNSFVVVGLLGNGTLHLTQAGTTAGAPVTGTFSGKVIVNPF